MELEISGKCGHKVGRPLNLDLPMRFRLFGGYCDAPPCRVLEKRSPELQPGEIAQSYRPQRQQSDRQAIASVHSAPRLM